MDIKLQTTGEKLKKILHIGGFTQNTLAIKMGVSFPTINSWLHNKSQPRDNFLEKIDILLSELEVKNEINKSGLKNKIDNILNKSKSIKNIFEANLFKRKDLFEDMLVKLTYHSDGIEGSTLTIRETASIILENINIKNKTLIEQIEAKNHKSALLYLFSYIQEKKEINEEFLLKLHQILMNSIIDNAGSYRYHPVRIVGSKTITANYLKVPYLIKELFTEFKNSKIDIITRASIFHSKFEAIHPFSDGNGRVGRLILNAMLLTHNIFPSMINKDRKIIYYNCLDKAFIDNDFDHITKFITESIEESYEEFGEQN